MRTESYILITVAAMLVNPVKADKNNRVLLQSFYCISNDPIFQNFTCSMKSVKRGLKVMNAEVFITEPIKNIWSSVEIFQKNSVWYLPFIVNSSDHLCSYFSGGGNRFFTKFGVRWLMKYCKFNGSCPMSGRQVCKDMMFTLDDVPSIIPPGEYRTLVKFYKNKNDKLCGTVTAHSLITLKPFKPLPLH